MILFDTKRLSARLLFIYSINSYSRNGPSPYDPVQDGPCSNLYLNLNSRQRQYEQLVMQAGSMKSKDFAEQWCKLMGEDAGKQLDMFGLGMYVDYAMPMCKCVTATVKDIGKTPRKHLKELIETNPGHA